MSRPSIFAALTALAIGTSVAQAQLPSIRRKAKDAARTATTGQPPQQRGAPPKFDNTILELNPQVVARLLKGLEARSTSRGARGLTAGELRRRSSAASEEAMNINNQHSDDRAQWVDANRNAESCVSDELSKMKEQHSQAMQQRITGMTGVATADNVKFMQEWGAASQEASQAAATHDTAAMNRAQEKMNKLMGIDPRADSAKARATCLVPPVPSWMRRADSLSASSDTLLLQARAAEDSARIAAAGAAGMTAEQFAMAAERAEGFVALQNAGNVGSRYVFTQIEEEALRARLAELKKYFG